MWHLKYPVMPAWFARRTIRERSMRLQLPLVGSAKLLRFNLNLENYDLDRTFLARHEEEFSRVHT